MVWYAILWVLLCGHLTSISTTLYLHRHVTHRSVRLHPSVAHIMRFWLWLTTGTRTVEWRAVHLAHHANPDRPGDPHSPVIYGLARVFFLGWKLYRRATHDPALMARYPGGPNDWVERKVYSAYPVLGVLLLCLVDLALFGGLGLAVWVVQILWIPLMAAGVVNGLGHAWGTRPYWTGDAARNIHVFTWPVVNFFFGFLTAGEEWHNHHHYDQGAHRFSRRWWQVDWGYGYFRLLGRLGLAQARPTTV
jgi:stearoyl-CoA desaturase (Delta-9 desaturase)